MKLDIGRHTSSAGWETKALERDKFRGGWMEVGGAFAWVKPRSGATQQYAVGVCININYCQFLNGTLIVHRHIKPTINNVFHAI